MTALELVGVLARCAFRFANEKDLQEGIAAAFTRQNVTFQREVRLDVGDIVDFMVGPVAVEVKIDGSVSALTRQLFRYSRHERVEEILVVCSRNRLANLPSSMGAKPIHVLCLAGGML